MVINFSPLIVAVVSSWKNIRYDRAWSGQGI